MRYRRLAAPPRPAALPTALPRPAALTTAPPRPAAPPTALPRPGVFPTALLRPGVLPTTLLRPAVLPTALLLPAVLLAGCEIDIAPSALPPPISIAPAPSGSAGMPKHACSATYKILTEGALKLATDAGNEAAMKRTLTSMAAEVDAQRSHITQPGLREALSDISTSLATGASTPTTYINGDFQTVGKELDTHCE
ncbi:hypothetical protein [Paractinoplanes brasiliensis]|nr:hypothetical protein [Actinoplanes brasiliensis]